MYVNERLCVCGKRSTSDLAKFVDARNPGNGSALLMTDLFQIAEASPSDSSRCTEGKMKNEKRSACRWVVWEQGKASLPGGVLKAILVGNPRDNTVDLSGIPLTLKELDRIIPYLLNTAEHIENVELCFTELTDEMFLQLLPVLSGLPHLMTLSLNGNRLTKTILRDLTEAVKDPKNFPSMTWIDLGNNVDIFSLPQPFLVSLKKRCPKQGNLPTILEFGEGQVSDLESQETPVESQDYPCSEDEDRSDCVDDARPRQVRTCEVIKVRLLPCEAPEEAVPVMVQT
uniref:Uncharacterized protein n=1 Tax=Sphaerodactylus townsendi TaxID=933632 RepID=A0ACB8EEK7_9SAUR